MRIFMVIVAVVLIGALGVGFYVYRLMSDMNSFATLEPHFDGTCTQVAGFAGGTEDIDIDRTSGWVFVSSFDRRAAFADPNNAPRGAIEVFHLNDPDAVFDATPSTPVDFQPHGISYYDGPEGRRLFVINHPADGAQAIEVFDLNWNRAGRPLLIHAETITDPLIVSPNDLVAVGPRSFYTGNDFSTADRGGLGYMLELYLRQDKTTLVYYDGEEGSIAARGLTYANGVNVSPDGETLYLAETTDGALRIFDRDVETGALTQRPGAEGLLRLGPGLDNIDVDALGRVWITAHPQPFKLQDHADNPENLSPAQVFMLTPSAEEGGSVAEIYLGDGSLASGSSVAIFDQGVMVIGVIFQPNVIVCRPTHPHVVGG